MSQQSFSDFKEKVRQTTDLVDMVSQFTQLKANGKNLKGLCPLPGHTEKTPSFNVNRDMQVYYCFGCQKGGDIFTFTQEVMGHSFKESLEYFAQKAGLRLPFYQKVDKSSNKSQPTPFQKKTEFFKVNALAKNIFQKTLETSNENHSARLYLQKRGLNQETIKHFEIGYAPDHWSFLSQKLLKYKDLAVNLGLIRKQASSSTHRFTQSGGYYDVYRNRIIFPIVTIKDEVAGFGGRCLIESDKEGKYINSPNSEIFHKGCLLYGLKMAAAHIRSLDQVIVVEGYMDVIALHQSGFKNVVGILGTALSANHANLLKNYTKNIILLFDSDKAGQTAAEKALTVLLENGLYPRSIQLPEGQDPDSMIKQWSHSKFREKLLTAPDLFESILKKHTAKNILSPTLKLQILDKMGTFIASMQDLRLKALYVQSLAEHLRLTPKHVSQYLLPQKTRKTLLDYSLRDKIADQKRQNLQSQQKQIVKKQIEKPALKAELMVAAIVANYPQYLKILEEKQILDKLSSEKILHFLKKIQDLSRHQVVNLDTLLAGLLTPDSKLTGMEGQTQYTQLIESIVFIGNEKNLSQIDRIFKDGITRIEEHFLKEQARITISNDTFHNASDIDTDGLKRFMEIQKTKHRL